MITLWQGSVFLLVEKINLASWEFIPESSKGESPQASNCSNYWSGETKEEWNVDDLGPGTQAESRTWEAGMEGSSVAPWLTGRQHGAGVQQGTDVETIWADSPGGGSHNLLSFSLTRSSDGRISTSARQIIGENLFSPRGAASRRNIQKTQPPGGLSSMSGSFRQV